MTDKDRARERMNYLIDQPQKLGRAGMPVDARLARASAQAIGDCEEYH